MRMPYDAAMYTKDGTDHLTAAEYLRMARHRKQRVVAADDQEVAVKRQSKYGNQKIVTPDGKFDSKAEYERFCELRLLEAAGQINTLRRQVVYQLSICKYIADFVYYDVLRQREVVEDVKGVRTAVYRMKARLMLKEKGIVILETNPKRLKRTRRNVRRVL